MPDNCSSEVRGGIRTNVGRRCMMGKNSSRTCIYPIEIINRLYDVRSNRSVGRTDVGLSVKS